MPAAVYVEHDDPEAFAQAVGDLLDDPRRRAVMGREGRRRIEDGLGWPHQAEAYRGVYDALLDPGRADATAVAETEAEPPMPRPKDAPPIVRPAAVVAPAAVDG